MALHFVPRKPRAEQIKELEAALGEPLFRKAGRGNVLTEAGQVAYRYTEEIFALGQEMGMEIHAQREDVFRYMHRI